MILTEFLIGIRKKEAKQWGFIQHRRYSVLI